MYIDIARGQVPYLSHVHKFGSNPEVHDTNPETVWSQGGLYPWASLSSAQTIYVKSTSSSDTGSLVVEGLDSEYNISRQTVSLTGTTAVTLSSTMLRVFRLEYSDTTNNIGTITARVGSGTGTIVGAIDPGINQSLMAVYTIPANQIGYLISDILQVI